MPGQHSQAFSVRVIDMRDVELCPWDEEQKASAETAHKHLFTAGYCFSFGSAQPSQRKNRDSLHCKVSTLFSQSERFVTYRPGNEDNQSSYMSAKNTICQQRSTYAFLAMIPSTIQLDI